MHVCLKLTHVNTQYTLTNIHQNPTHAYIQPMYKQIHINNSSILYTCMNHTLTSTCMKPALLYTVTQQTYNQQNPFMLSFLRHNTRCPLCVR